MKLSTVIILMIGGTLVYSAIKDKNPGDVLKLGLQGKSTTGGGGGGGTQQKTNLPNTPTVPGQVITSV